MRADKCVPEREHHVITQLIVDAWTQQQLLPLRDPAAAAELPLQMSAPFGFAKSMIAEIRKPAVEVIVDDALLRKGGAAEKG